MKRSLTKDTTRKSHHLLLHEQCQIIVKHPGKHINMHPSIYSSSDKRMFQRTHREVPPLNGLGAPPEREGKRQATGHLAPGSL